MKNKIFKSILILLTAITLAFCGGGSNEKKIKLYPVKNGDLYQYIDREGKIVINPQFSEATFFRDGLALVRSSGPEPKWGYISEVGTYVIPPQYSNASVFSEGIAWTVKKDGVPTAIGVDGSILFSTPSADIVNNFSEGLASFGIIDTFGAKMGFLDTKGKIIIAPQHAAVGVFSDGICRVMNSKNKWGYVDKTGQLVIKYLFDYAMDFYNGATVVKLGEKRGVIDKSGIFIINPQYDDIIIDGERYLIKLSNKWGWCDRAGKTIINPQFDNALPFGGNELASVSNNDNWGYIDKTGKYLINPQFQRALPFNFGIAPIQLDSKLGFINDKGKIIINPQFENYGEILTTDLISPNQSFSTVMSDYFDIDKIINYIDIFKPEGFDFNQSVDVIAKKSNNKGFKYDLNKTEHEIIHRKMLTKDANYSFWIIANTSKAVADGWYTKNIYDPNSKPDALAYTIELSSTRLEKENDLMLAMEKKLQKYEKDMNSTTNEIKAFKVNNTIVKVLKSKIYSLIVVVYKPT